MKEYQRIIKACCSAEHYLELNRYRPGSCPSVAEAGTPLDPFSERHLHCIWFDARLRPDGLATERGEEVRILHPGRWNEEKGPDFLDAEWVVGGRRFRGDVEMHIRPMDWVHHRHQTDPAYRQVGLHVTYEPGELPEGMLPAGCGEISLKSVLAQRSHFFFDQIDVRAYPHQKSGDSSALQAFFQEKSDEERARLLEAAGQERIRRKALRMARVIRAVGEEQALYLALLRGLGYKHNAEVSETLGRALPFSKLKRLAGGSEEKIFACLAGLAGLLPTDPEEAGLPVWLDVRRLWDIWWPHQLAFSGKALPRDQWRLDHCRPGNHPLRRLRAAACWVAEGDSLAEAFSPAGGEAEKDWVRRCMKRLQVSSPCPEQEPDQLVGRVRAGTLLLNALLPWRICTGKTVPGEKLWKSLPDEAFNSKIRKTGDALFGVDQHPRIYRGGLRKQGLLQFYEDFQI